MIVLIVFLLGGIVFTSYYASSHVSTSDKNVSSMNGGGNAPSMPDSNTGSTAGDNSSSGSSDDNASSVPDKPNDSGNSNNMSEPPAKPGSDNSSNNSSSSKSSNSSDSNMTEPPAKPDSSSDNSSENSNNSSGDVNNNGGNQPDSNGGMPGGNLDMNNSVKLSCIYYVIFGVLGLFISLIVMYLVMSCFNRKGFKEAFYNKDKIIIYILSIVIMSCVICFGSGFVTENYVIDGSSSNNSSTSYSASEEITSSKKISNKSYSSSSSDKNAVLVDGDISVSMNKVTVSKTGDSDGGDNTSFYGTNSGIIAKGGSVLTIKNSTIKTSAKGANGVFSYGGSATTNNSSSDGTTVNISDSKITTTKDNSGGIMTTGGGKMNASNLTINTSGTSSAAIRTDRGGGTVKVNGGTYTTNGKGSPSIYSTADITVSKAKLVSNVSEGVVIEGKNKVSLNDCILVDSNTKLNGQSTTYKNVFLYQSMSGDAASGKAEFSSKNSSITTKKGDSFYVTNTNAYIYLENNDIVNTDSSGNFLRIKKDSWGNEGSNGGDVTLVMKNQSVTGNIVVDEISSLEMSLKSGSSYEGVINGDNSAKSLKLSLSKDSKIKLTGNSYVTSLSDDDSSYSNIDFNGYKLYVNGKAIN